MSSPAPGPAARVARFLPRLRVFALGVAATETTVGALLSQPALLVAGGLSAAFGLLIYAVDGIARQRGGTAADRTFAVGVALLGVATAALLPGVAPAAAMLPILGIVPLLPAESRRQEIVLLAGALVAGMVMVFLGDLPKMVPALPAPAQGAFASATLLGVVLLMAISLVDLSRQVRESFRAQHIAGKRQQAIFDRSLGAMLLVGDDRVVTDANPAAVRLLGIPGDALVGMSIDAFHPREGDRAALWRQFLAGGPAQGRSMIHRGDGSQRLVEASAHANVVPGQHLVVWHDLTDRVRDDEERRTVLAALGRLQPRASADETGAAVAAELNRLPGIDVTVVFAIDDDAVKVLAVESDIPFPLKSGDVMPASPRAAYLLGRLREGAWGELWEESSAVGEQGRQIAATGIRGQAYAPVLLDGVLVGAIAVATTDPAYARHLVEDVPAVEEFAAAAGVSLAPQLRLRRQLVAERAGVAEIVREGAFAVVFQPVVDIGSGRIVGFEALSRFATGQPPDQVFAQAVRAGLWRDLEEATLRRATQAAPSLPADAWLSLNVSPAMLTAPGLLQAVLAGTDRAVVLEVSEHDPIPDYGTVRRAFERLGPQVRLAVDDAGAGEANLAHIVELRAQFVKLDMRLVRGVDSDLVRQALIVGLHHFAEASGCTLIAEGIETAAELRVLEQLGVTLGQGYLLGRPAPAPRFRRRSLAA